MGYSGASLVDLFKPSTTQPRQPVREIADAAGRELTERTRRNTPVDTGEVRSSWYKLPTKRVANGYRSGTASDHHRAPWVEYGIEPHDIEPREAQALDGSEGSRARVRHPGYGGAFMVVRAAAEVEAELPAIAQPALERWKRGVEQRAKRHKGIT